MNTPNVIMAVKAISKNPNNNVWIVYFSNDNDEKFYCKSAYKAMRLMFLLKKRTGLNISDNCLARLSFEVARIKAAAAAATEKEVKQEPESAPVEEKPKKKRGRKPKAEEAA